MKWWNHKRSKIYVYIYIRQRVWQEDLNGGKPTENIQEKEPKARIYLGFKIFCFSASNIINQWWSYDHHHKSVVCFLYYYDYYLSYAYSLGQSQVKKKALVMVLPIINRYIDIFCQEMITIDIHGSTA